MWRNKEQATYGEKMIKCIRQHGAKLLCFEKHLKDKISEIIIKLIQPMIRNQIIKRLFSENTYLEHNLHEL